jgi:hypothetical protein
VFSACIFVFAVVGCYNIQFPALVVGYYNIQFPAVRVLAARSCASKMSVFFPSWLRFTEKKRKEKKRMKIGQKYNFELILCNIMVFLSLHPQVVFS